ncbi:50S ribosomal protein L11 methyltransferase [Azospirillum sp. B510]|uniref:50S ribosomal protein L11 methyltransferase n=1 Tax=Azospirillum sp. (strain B510) TaxID=137722 RepID=UPI0002E6716E|nr:50S ribosomal protein L11 methyltransferase [Azospirillum sp. B510]
MSFRPDDTQGSGPHEGPHEGKPAPLPRPPDVHFDAALHLRLLLRVDRTETIRRALRGAIRGGDRVLDAGCGSGLLSFLALEAGAGEVVAVDRDNVDLARDLARANGLSDRIRFIEGDLNALAEGGGDGNGLGRFDALLAFIYANHIIIDEPRSRLVCALRRRFGGDGCRMVPDRVRYLAIPCDWPGLDPRTELADLRRSVEEIETRYGLRLGPLLDAVAGQIGFERSRPDNSGDYGWSPGAGSGGYRHRRAGRFLGDRHLVADIRYGDGAAFDRLPSTLTLTAEADGLLNAVMWVQELWFGDMLIWVADSFSPAESPLAVAAGSRVTVPLDESWRRTNRIRPSR